MNKKIKKLLRDPKLFFKDMVLNYTYRKSKPPILFPKYTGEFRYVIVCSIYNVEKYLDDFCNSLINQTMSLKRSLHIIFVDDGSQDQSAQIIKKFKAKYPTNVTYLLKENGGLSSARNFGLDYIEKNNLNFDYVTFPDPDDFLDRNYFEKIDVFLSKNKNCQIISCNLIYFYEHSKTFKDIHPLNYRFKKTQLVNTDDFKDNVLLSSATAVYKLDSIQKLELRFDEFLKPSFEDCKFNNQLLIATPNIHVGFLKEARYFYRQRRDSSSLMNNAWQREGLFSTVLEDGVLSILRTAHDNFGYVPDYVQRVALFHCIGYYRRLVNSSHHVDFLSLNVREKFTQNLLEVFQYIDTTTIEKCAFPNLQQKHKVGLLALYKNSRPQITYAYVNFIDVIRRTISISFFTGFIDDEVLITLDGMAVIPEGKLVSNDFLGVNFYYECRVLVPYDSVEQRIEFIVNGKFANLACFGISVTGGDLISKFVKAMRKNLMYPVLENTWVLMDRIDRADDNAEHFYRYMMHNHPEQKMYFALDRNSSDWDRLKNDGFNLIDYSSAAFSRELVKCKCVISSHLFIWNHFAKKGSQLLALKRKIWLQHGVICNNNANVVNTKPMDFMVTSTQNEHDSIVNQFSEYNLLPSQVHLCGMPRHDVLLKKAVQAQQENIVLVMPTWRTWLKNEPVIESEYFQKWQSFLTSSRLIEVLQKNNFRMVFAPHKELEESTTLFAENDLVSIWSSDNGSIQDLFVSSKLMITDYSSVAFDMGFLNKPVCYYQFDRDSFFSQHYKAGYFDFYNNGFGPVAHTEEELLGHLEQILHNGGAVSEPYVSRIINTFPYRDGGCSERVYQAILNLDVPKTDDVNFDALNHAYINAKANRAWNLLETRSKALMCLFDEGQLNDRAQCDAHYRVMLENDLLASLIAQNKLTQAFDYLRQVPAKTGSYWEYRLAWALGNDEFCYDYLRNQIPQDAEDWVIYACCCAKLGHDAAYTEAKTALVSFELQPNQATLLVLADCLIKQDYQTALNHIDSYIEDDVSYAVQDIKIELVGYQLCMRTGEFTKARDYLVAYEKHTEGDPQCELAIAHLAFAQSNFQESVDKYKPLLYQFNCLISNQCHVAYLDALVALKKWDDIASYIENPSLHTNIDLSRYKIYYLFHEKKWHEVIDVFENAQPIIQNDHYFEYVSALLRVAKWDDAKQKHREPNNSDSYEYWSLIYFLGKITNDLELQEHCLLGKIATCPETDMEANFTKLELLRTNKN